MRTADAHHQNPNRPHRNWVAETLIVLGILAFGLFVLTLEGQVNLLGAPQPGVALPYELTR